MGQGVQRRWLKKSQVIHIKKLTTPGSVLITPWWLPSLLFWAILFIYLFIYLTCRHPRRRSSEPQRISAPYLVTLTLF